MVNIVTREVGPTAKGSPLLNTEVDNNFINLNTGKLEKDNAQYLEFDTAAPNTAGVAKLTWNDGDGTLEFGLKGGNVNLQIGQEQVVLVKNNNGSAFTDGQVVYITGAQGNRPTVSLADADSEATSSKTFGIVTETIAASGEGFITTSGLVRNLNTSAFSEGVAIWLSSTAGAFTATKPAAPTHSVMIGWVVRSHATVGAIFVHVQNGHELDELHDVLIAAKANNDSIMYDSTAGVWKNVTPSVARTNLDVYSKDEADARFINTSGDSVNLNGLTINTGTANGVAYLNGSKVLTTGSALTFDGTTLATTGKFGISGSGAIPTASALEIGSNGANTRWRYNVPTGGEHNFTLNGSVISWQNDTSHGWYASGSEQMRLTSTGLGIGTSSPVSALNVVGTTGVSFGTNIKGLVTIGTQGTSGSSLFVNTPSLNSTYNSGFAVDGLYTNPGGGVGTSVIRLKALGVYSGGGYDSAMAFYTTSGVTESERMRIDSDGNLLVGTTVAAAAGGEAMSWVMRKADNAIVYHNCNTTASTPRYYFFNPNGVVGTISVAGSTTTYNTSSDYRLKENIQPMQNALDVVAQLNPVRYTWKADGSDGQGFIAHELQAVVPDCVTGDKDAVDKDGKPVYQGIDTSFLVATLTKAIQEQQEQINQLKAEVAALKGN